MLCFPEGLTVADLLLQFLLHRHMYGYPAKGLYIAGLVDGKSPVLGCGVKPQFRRPESMALQFGIQPQSGWLCWRPHWEWVAQPARKRQNRTTSCNPGPNSSRRNLGVELEHRTMGPDLVSPRRTIGKGKSLPSSSPVEGIAMTRSIEAF